MMTREERALLVATSLLLERFLEALQKTPAGRPVVSQAWRTARESLGELAKGNALLEVAAEDVLMQIDRLCHCGPGAPPPSWKPPPR